MLIQNDDFKIIILAQILNSILIIHGQSQTVHVGLTVQLDVLVKIGIVLVQRRRLSRMQNVVLILQNRHLLNVISIVSSITTALWVV